MLWQFNTYARASRYIILWSFYSPCMVYLWSNELSAWLATDLDRQNSEPTQCYNSGFSMKP